MYFYRRKTLSEELGVSVRTIFRWEATGILPRARRIGPRIVGWPVEEIQRIVNALPLRKAPK